MYSIYVICGHYKTLVLTHVRADEVQELEDQLRKDTDLMTVAEVER